MIPLQPNFFHTWALNTTEFNYKWEVVTTKSFTRNAEQREAVLLWLSSIAADRERAEWVATPRLSI